MKAMEGRGEGLARLSHFVWVSSFILHCGALCFGHSPSEDVCYTCAADTTHYSVFFLFVLH